VQLGVPVHVGECFLDRGHQLQPIVVLHVASGATDEVLLHGAHAIVVEDKVLRDAARLVQPKVQRAQRVVLVRLQVLLHGRVELARVVHLAHAGGQRRQRQRLKVVGPAEHGLGGGETAHELIDLVVLLRGIHDGATAGRSGSREPQRSASAGVGDAARDGRERLPGVRLHRAAIAGELDGEEDEQRQQRREQQTHGAQRGAAAGHQRALQQQSAGLSQPQTRVALLQRRVRRADNAMSVRIHQRGHLLWRHRRRRERLGALGETHQRRGWCALRR